MTGLFIRLFAVTVILAGFSLPCFFRRKGLSAGCFFLSVSVILFTVMCFFTPVKAGFSAFGKADAVYFSALFAAALLTSLFYRMLFPFFLILYLAYNSIFLISVSRNYVPASSQKEFTFQNRAECSDTVSVCVFPDKFLLLIPKVWYSPESLYARVSDGAGTDASLSGSRTNSDVSAKAGGKLVQFLSGLSVIKNVPAVFSGDLVFPCVFRPEVSFSEDDASDVSVLMRVLL